MRTHIFETVYPPTHSIIQRFIFALGGMILFLMLIVPNIFDIIPWNVSLVFLLVGILLLGWEAKRTDKGMFGKALTLSEAGIFQKVGSFTQHVSYDAVQHIVLLHNKRMKLEEIVIVYPRKAIILKDYQSLPRILAALQLHLPSQTPLKKTSVLSLSAVYAKYKYSMFLVGWLLLFAWIYSFFFGLPFSRGVDLLLFPFMLVTLLMSRPSSKANKKGATASYTLVIVLQLMIVPLLFYSKLNDTWHRPFHHPCGYVEKFQNQSGCIRVLDKSDIVAFLDDDTVVREVMHSILFEKIDGNSWLNNIFARRLHHQEPVANFDLSQDGTNLLAYQNGFNLFSLLDFSAEREISFILWDVDSKKNYIQQVVDNDSLIDFSATGMYAVIRQKDESEKIEIWDSTNEQLIRHIMSRWLKFSTDGSLYALLNEGEVMLFDIKTGALTLTLTPPAQTGVAVETIIFSDNDRFLAARTSESILVWNLFTGQLEEEIPFSGSLWNSVFEISPNGRYLAYAEKFDIDTQLDEAIVNVWDINNSELAYQSKLGRNRFINLESIAFSPENKILGVGVDDEIILFDLVQMTKPAKIVTEE